MAGREATPGASLLPSSSLLALDSMGFSRTGSQACG